MKRQAFTMIEIVFIVIILGILAAIAIPKISASRSDAKVVALRQDIATITQALTAMVVSQGRYLRPDATDLWGKFATFGDIAALNQTNWSPGPSRDFNNTWHIHSLLATDGSSTNDYDYDKACVVAEINFEDDRYGKPMPVLDIEIRDSPLCRKIGTPGSMRIPLENRGVKWD